MRKRQIYCANENINKIKLLYNSSVELSLVVYHNYRILQNRLFKNNSKRVD